MYFKVSVWIQNSQRQWIDSLKKENKSQNLCSNTTRGSVTLGLSLFWVILQNTGSSISQGTLGMCLRFHTFSWYLLFPSSLVKVFLPLREKKKKKKNISASPFLCVMKWTRLIGWRRGHLLWNGSSKWFKPTFIHETHIESYAALWLSWPFILCSMHLL